MVIMGESVRGDQHMEVKGRKTPSSGQFEELRVLLPLDFFITGGHVLGKNQGAE